MIPPNNSDNRQRIGSHGGLLRYHHGGENILEDPEYLYANTEFETGCGLPT